MSIMDAFTPIGCVAPCQHFTLFPEPAPLTRNAPDGTYLPVIIFLPGLTSRGSEYRERFLSDRPKGLGTYR